MLDPEWRLYARSASDDKAPIVAMLAAVDRLRAKNVKPRFNLRFVFEGEEEAGSPHLGAFLEKYADVLRPDAWIICDGPVHQSRRAQLAFGARGVLTLDLLVYGPARGLHDGHYGNWVPNPIVALTHLIDSMRDENGRILIDGFYDDVVPATPAEKAAIAAMPPVEAELRREFQIGRTEGASLNERILLPALNVSGIQSGGVGEKASNTIQTSARAAIDFRLVPSQTPDSVKARVERHLIAKGWTIVRDDPDAATASGEREDRPRALGRRLSARAHAARSPSVEGDRRADDSARDTSRCACRRWAAACRSISSSIPATRPRSSCRS